MSTLQFRDLHKQYEVMKPQIDSAIQMVIEKSNFISGDSVKELESSLASYVGVKHCITCANGTDAITIGLMAMGLKKTDAVFVPDFTFFSSGECPAALELPTYFVDVKEQTYNIDSKALEETIKRVIAAGKHTPKVVIAVDLFGQPAEYKELRSICDKYNMTLFEDGAQGFGGAMGNKKACSFGDISTTSFFPAKPLGCYGDGGAIFTDNDEWAIKIRSLCVHGKDMSNPEDPNAKYNNVRLGMNSRLDTIQAAILLAKLPYFIEKELGAINRIASRYNELLKDLNIVLPQVSSGGFSSWAQYTIQLPDEADRKYIQAEMKKAGVPTMVYYERPMHKQLAFEDTVSAMAECPVTEKLCKSVLCLPIHPYMEDSDVKFVVDNLKKLL